MPRYYTDIQFYWPGEPMRQDVIYLGRDKLWMTNHLEAEGWHYCYALFNIREVECETLIDQGTPDALVMAILCDFQDKPVQQVVNHIVPRLRGLTGDDELARLRHPRQWLQNILGGPVGNNTGSLQYLRYRFDPLGNLQSREDRRQYSKETCGYDRLNQLTGIDTDLAGSASTDDFGIRLVTDDFGIGYSSFSDAISVARGKA